MSILGAVYYELTFSVCTTKCNNIAISLLLMQKKSTITDV